MKPMRTLRQCLIDTELTHLRVIARLWGLDVKTTRLLEVAAELAEALADPQHAAHTWEALPPDQRVALAALLEAGGVMSTATFRRRFGQIRPMGPGRLEREMPWRTPISPAEGLWYRGLIYEGFAGEGSATYAVFVVPPELQAALPVSAEASGSTIQPEPALPPAHRRSAGDLLLDDVTSVLAFVHNETVHPRADALHAWSEQVEQALRRELRDPDVERLALTLHLINWLDWTRLDDGGRLRLVAEPVMSWLQGAAIESRAALVNAWREMTNWNELWRLPSLQPDDTGTWRNDPTLARATLLRHLAALTPGRWVKISDFMGAIKSNDPDFQRPGGDYGDWYIRDAASGAYLSGFESWDQVEGALLRALLTGAAWWLSLVELGGPAAGDPPEVFCPLPESPPGADPPPPVVHPDLTIAMPSGRRFERFQLARVADMVQAGTPYVYRLTPASLHRARKQHISPAQVLEFLDGLNDAPLPKTVRSSLTRWGERGTEVWLERTVLFRTTDEATLQQILAAPTTSRYLGRVVGPTAAVVAEKDWPGLVAALAALGFLAKIVDSEAYRPAR